MDNGAQDNLEEMSFGTRLANRVAQVIGSWRFLITQSVILALWITFNTLAFIHHWDNYPYILLNLTLSFQAAYTGPILLIAANAAARHDRAQADRDSAILERLTAMLTKVEQLEERELVQLGVQP